MSKKIYRNALICIIAASFTGTAFAAASASDYAEVSSTISISSETGVDWNITVASEESCEETTDAYEQPDMMPPAPHKIHHSEPAPEPSPAKMKHNPHHEPVPYHHDAPKKLPSKIKKENHKDLHNNKR
ncbi:MAG: hypothetical protein K6G00_10620 [Treponema sp.]|nr:hypothetical protein [Treponema sp.]